MKACTNLNGGIERLDHVIVSFFCQHLTPDKYGYRTAKHIKEMGCWSEFYSITLFAKAKQTDEAQSHDGILSAHSPERLLMSNSIR
jgi:hypothetical protein